MSNLDLTWLLNPAASDSEAPVLKLCGIWSTPSLPMLISSPHQTELDTSSMTRKSIKVGVEGRDRALAETWTLLDCAGH